MGEKLYPPYIEGKLPAFTDLKLVKIPFEMNKTVGKNDFNGMKLIIKDVYTNNLIGQASTNICINNIAQFNCSSLTLNSNQYYKVQLAYTAEDEETKKTIIGYYSTVGIIKYTTAPEITIVSLFSKPDINLNKEQYQGQYYNEDSTEKVHSYRFDLYDPDIGTDPIYSSGWLLHNNENDKDGTKYSFDNFELNYYLEEDKTYLLSYKIKTINDLEIESDRYKICNSKTIDPEIKGDLIAELNRDNAYINLKIAAPSQEKVSGHFRIVRASSENNFATWETITAFSCNEKPVDALSWKDYAIRHGDTYRYAIQQYNAYGFYSNKKTATADVEAVFDDAFLFDGKRQLKIKYNPKISSFKTNVLEQKTNTIGAKFPVFSRNGYVSYKEFPISGLISYLSDEENLFMTDVELGLNSLDLVRQETPADATWLESFKIEIVDSEGHEFTIQNDDGIEQTHKYQIENARQRTTNLTDYNITAERNFKMAVLDFLTNGKPKLFKSPVEGNYIVYLMNSSLAPNDTLGRMLHTFSTTATEIENYSYDGLRKQNIIEAFDKVVIDNNINSQFNKYKSIIYKDYTTTITDPADIIAQGKIEINKKKYDVTKVYSLEVNKTEINGNGYIRLNNQKLTPIKKTTIINDIEKVTKLSISENISITINCQYSIIEEEAENNESTS